MYNWSQPTEDTRTCFLCGAVFPAEGHTLRVDICPACAARERDRVRAHLRRAQEHGAPATLTLLAWLETLDYFGGQCAYCRKRPFTHLEHFEPIAGGGGTTADNCVPACESCNRGKAALNPEAQPTLPLPEMEDIRVERVRHYLASRRDSRQEALPDDAGAAKDDSDDSPPPYNWAASSDAE